MEIALLNLVSGVKEDRMEITLIKKIANKVISFFTPWVNWDIEKRKRKLLWRKEFIDKCRKTIEVDRFNPDRFKETSCYSTLKLHLSNKLQKEIERKRYTPGSLLSIEKRKEIMMKEFRIKKSLLDEISLIEKKWGLL